MVLSQYKDIFIYTEHCLYDMKPSSHLLVFGLTSAFPTISTPSIRSLSSLCNDVNDSPKPEYVDVGSAKVLQGIEAGSLDGVDNFRDFTTGVKDNVPFANITTTGGKKLRHGLVYRSNQLNNATNDDLSRIAGANITKDVDLRMFVERAASIDRLPPPTQYTVQDVFAPCNGIGVDGSVVEELGTDVVQMLESLANGTFSLKDNIIYDTMYKALAVYEGANVGYHNLLHEIAYENLPIVYHCTAGKDRTGVATAYLQRILGVDLEIINDAYLASNYYLGQAGAVKQEYLQSTWDVIDEVWGSFDNFVEKGLKLSSEDVKALQNRLLE